MNAPAPGMEVWPFLIGWVRAKYSFSASGREPTPEEEGFLVDLASHERRMTRERGVPLRVDAEASEKEALMLAYDRAMDTAAVLAAGYLAHPSARWERRLEDALNLARTIHGFLCDLPSGG